jgi:putative spermidine/putrescine transport system permease protein
MNPTAAPSAPAPRTRSREHHRVPAWRWIIFAAALIYFVGPLIAAFKYSLIDQHGHYNFHNYAQIVSNSAVRSSLYISLEIAIIAAVFVVVLMLPTVVLVRLRLPRFTTVLEGVTILPIVIPPVVIAAGMEEMQGHAPHWVVSALFNHPLTGLTPFYVILALPFTYRALDNGLRAIDLRTLTDASRSLGASWLLTLARVVLPNVLTAVLGAMFLTIALCLGEVVISTLMLYTTLPVEMIAISKSSAGVSVAISLLALIFTFVLLFVLSTLAGHRRGSATVRVI